MLKFKLTYDAEKKSVKQSLNILLVTTKKYAYANHNCKKNLYKYISTHIDKYQLNEYPFICIAKIEQWLWKGFYGRKNKTLNAHIVSLQNKL